MAQTMGVDAVNVKASSDGSLKIDVLFWGLHEDGRKEFFSANSLVYHNEWSAHMVEIIRGLVQLQVEETLRPFVPLSTEGDVKDLWTFTRERLNLP